MQTGDKNYIYKNDLDKDCFQHDMAYVKYKDLTKRIQPDKVLKDKAFKIASNPKYDGYQRGLASIVFKFFDKKSVGGVVLNQQCQVSNFQMNIMNQLLENLKEEEFIHHLKTILGVLI